MGEGVPLNPGKEKLMGSEAEFAQLVRPTDGSFLFTNFRSIGLSCK